MTRIRIINTGPIKRGHLATIERQPRMQPPRANEK
jgi:hypothetical protein